MGVSQGKCKSILMFVLVACLMLAACRSAPVLPTATTPTATRTVAPTPTTQPSPTPQPTPSPSGPVLPDPKSDPLGALLYSDFPASLGRAGFTASFLLTADQEENLGYGIEWARSFGTLDVIDYAANVIDMELHITYSIAMYGQDLHVIKLGDQAWARFMGIQWLESDREALFSEDAERMLWGGWYPLYALEPFDSAAEVAWIEAASLGGEPAHHLHVVFDAQKMDYLDVAANAQYEYFRTSLLDGEYYGDPVSTDVQAEVWLAAEDLAVRQIDMLIQIVTQEDGEQTHWAISRTIQFEVVDPGPISVPVLAPAGADATDCSQVTEIPETECQALLALYANTDGAAWTNVEGWLVANSPCTWGGVTCRDGHVVWLMLQNAGLTGEMPPELAELQWLEVLYLTGNNLVGTIPPELGSLGNLQALDLSSNWGLSGEIPGEFGNLGNLQELNLNLSGLSGPLPETLTALPLIYLDIGGTSLCVPDTPAFREWTGKINNFGMITPYDGLESIYCQPAPD